jgi:hypothetical protein
MFIFSYFRKKPIIKVKEDTLENLDDDFIVISDNLNSISIEKNEENVKNIVDCSEEISKSSCSADTSILNSTSFSRGDEENDILSFSASLNRRDEENDILSFSASLNRRDEENHNTLFSASLNRRDEENQLIENTKEDDYLNLSFCDKIIKDVITFIFGEDVIRKIKVAHNL